MPVRVLARWLLGAGFAVLSATPQAIPFTQLYVFGDSQVTHGVPWSPHFADVLAERLGVGPLSRALAGGTNYAFFGARAAHVLFQVELFRTQAGAADPEALYLLYGGGNDMAPLVGASLSEAQAALATAAATMASAVQGLYDEGARHILVATPGAPAFLSATLIAGEPLLFLDFYGDPLAAALDAIDGAHADLTVAMLSLRELHRQLAAGAPGNGLSNLTDPCHIFQLDEFDRVVPIFTCDAPDTYLYYDGVHYSRTAQAYFGNAAAALFVPEPVTALLLPTGLIVVSRVSRLRAGRVAVTRRCA
jgi:outer membrane lipase/esterase